MVIVFVVCWAKPAPLSGQDLEDKRLNYERYHYLKNHQCGDVETKEVYASEPVFLNLGRKSFLCEWMDRCTILMLIIKSVDCA